MIRKSCRLLCWLMIPALFGCGKSASRFGAVLPLTGSAAVYGQSIRKGIDLAFDELRKNPVYGPLELTVVDSGSDPARAASELEKVYDGGALAAIGGVTSAEALAMVRVADKANQVLLSPSASQPQLTGISTNFFRVFPSDFAEGTVMAKYAFDTLKVKTVVILAKQETYAKGIQQVFDEEFRKKGGQVLELIEFPGNATDFQALVDRVATLKPDAAYVAAYANELSRIIPELRAQGFAGYILTTSSFATAESVGHTGPAAEGTLFTQSAFDIDDKSPDHVKTFAAGYKAKYGHAPDLYAAHGYDSMMVLAEAMRQGGKSSSSFWKGMRSIHEFPGVTGTFQFDEKGDVQKFPHVYVVRDGKAIDVEKERQKALEEARRKMQEIERQLRELQQGS